MSSMNSRVQAALTLLGLFCATGSCTSSATQNDNLIRVGGPSTNTHSVQRQAAKQKPTKFRYSSGVPHGHLELSGGASGGTQDSDATVQLSRPGRFDHARTARWLVASNSWGVVSTTSVHLGGAPFGNIASFSDLINSSSSGTPYFYLSTLDYTAADAEVNPICSFTLSEEPLGTCGVIDPEDPLCAKLTLTGRLERVVDGTEEYSKAQEGLFEKHAEMKKWPADHHFHVYALRISDIFLIDFFGGPRPLTVKKYYHVDPPFDFSFKKENHAL